MDYLDEYRMINASRRRYIKTQKELTMNEIKNITTGILDNNNQLIEQAHKLAIENDTLKRVVEIMEEENTELREDNIQLKNILSDINRISDMNK